MRTSQDEERGVKVERQGTKTYYKGLGFCGGGVNSNTCEVDVKDGKIIRTRPFHYDRCYTPEEMNAWTIHARGSEYSASMKSLIPVLVGI